MFMDIDGARVTEKYFKPSYAWETSPKKVPRCMVLDNPLNPDEQEKVARTLIKSMGLTKQAQTLCTTTVFLRQSITEYKE